jgi:hypothetical protein
MTAKLLSAISRPVYGAVALHVTQVHMSASAPMAAMLDAGATILQAGQRR